MVSHCPSLLVNRARSKARKSDQTSKLRASSFTQCCTARRAQSFYHLSSTATTFYQTVSFQIFIIRVREDREVIACAQTTVKRFRNRANCRVAKSKCSLARFIVSFMNIWRKHGARRHRVVNLPVLFQLLRYNVSRRMTTVWWKSSHPKVYVMPQYELTVEVKNTREWRAVAGELNEFIFKNPPLPSARSSPRFDVISIVPKCMEFSRQGFSSEKRIISVTLLHKT